MVISDPRHRECSISQKQDGRNIYVIMKTMCPPGYHHNGFVATRALGNMMYGSFWVLHHVPKCMSCHKAIVVITGRAHCFHDYVYIHICMHILKHVSPDVKVSNIIQPKSN